MQQEVVRFRHSQAKISSAPGRITILDTNGVLHYQLPDSIWWPEIVDQESVRLVIPLRVIEKLDAKRPGGVTLITGDIAAHPSRGPPAIRPTKLPGKYLRQPDADVR
jgi:hypothetical protein